MKGNFKDKVIWVTGASSGIGEELVIQLAERGAKIVLSARNSAKLEALKMTLKGNAHLVLPLDLQDSSAFTAKVSTVIKHFGRIDMLVNNGGVSQRSTAAETNIEIDRKIMEINYFGPIALTKAVLPFMKAQRSGHFVVISSISGKFGFFLRSAYSASKHALHGFYESLFLEEETNGIAVTMICPGKINTKISMNAITGQGGTYGVMDHNQETGMSVQNCVNEIIKALITNKKEVCVGNKEILMVKIKRYFPSLFWKIIRKQSAT